MTAPPLRTAVLTDEVSQDLGRAIALAQRHGLDGLEIRSVGGVAPHEFPRAACQRIRARVADAGLRIVALASPAFKGPLPRSAASRAAARDVFERSAERADWLGAPVLRVFSFLRDGPPAPGPAAEAVAEAARPDRALPFTLAVETGTPSNTPGGAEMAAFLARLPSTGIGVVWDPGNGVFSGFDPHPYPAAYDLLAAHIVHIHVKDPLGQTGYTKLGEGDVPWAAILGRLRTDGYSGVLSLETHWRLGQALTAAQRARPWGAAFSAGGEVASDRCLAVLTRLAAGS